MHTACAESMMKARSTCFAGGARNHLLPLADRRRGDQGTGEESGG
jgi:hypothetical protein